MASDRARIELRDIATVFATSTKDIMYMTRVTWPQLARPWDVEVPERELEKLDAKVRWPVGLVVSLVSFLHAWLVGLAS